MKMIPMMDGGDDVGMVLSPQCFHNLNAEADIFNHSNIHFWECAPPSNHMTCACPTSAAQQ